MADRLTRAERETFLADVHVGVLSVAAPDPDRAPLSTPVWYTYSPESGVTVILNGQSRKGRAIEAARRYTLVAQSEAVPYRYVSVDGPVVEIRRVNTQLDFLPLAVRYLGEDHGKSYTQDLEAQGLADTDYVYVMKPEHWNTSDFTADLT